MTIEKDNADVVSHPEFFAGVRHLSKNERGIVYWRDTQVEHYTYNANDKDREAAAAQSLGAWCRELESKNFPVNSRTAINRDLFGPAPKDTPWLKTMLHVYNVFTDEKNKAAAIVLALKDKENPQGAVLQVVDGQPQVKYHADTETESGAYQLFHHMQRNGYRSAMVLMERYERFVTAMDEAGITPQMVEEVFANVPPAPVPEPEDEDSPRV